MANFIEFFVKMKDMMSNPLVKLGATAQKTFTAVQKNMEGVGRKNNLLGASFDELSRKIAQTESVIGKSRIPSQIAAARKELESLQRMQSKHIGNTSNRQESRSGGGGMLSGLMPAMGIAGVMALGGQALSMGLEAQATKTSFEVMAGAKAGEKLAKDLAKFSQDSIYGNEVNKQAQMMLGFGAKVKDVMPDLKMIGDISMGDSVKMGALVRAFSQTRAAGKLTGEDLNQMIDQGFNPLAIMAEKSGMKMSDLKEQMSKGAISFDMVKAAFVSSTSAGGKYFQMTDKIAKTDFGKWQAFKGSLEAFGAKIGGMLAPALGDLLTNYLNPMLDVFSQMATWIQANADWLGLLVTVVGSAILVYKGVILATQAWAAAQMLLNVAMALNPIGLVIAGIAALVLGIVYAWNKFEGFRMVVLGLWDSFKQVFENIGNYFKMIFAPIGEALDAFEKRDFKRMGKAVGQLAYNLSPVGMVVNTAKFAQNGGFTNGVVDAYKTGAEKGKNPLAKIVKDGAEKQATKANDSVFDSLKTAVQKKKDKEADKDVTGVTGSGPKTINITVQRFTDKIEVHSASLPESVGEIERSFTEMFLRVLNSGAVIG